MNKIVVFCCLCCFSYAALAQNHHAKWTLGLSGSLVNFGDAGSKAVGDRFLYQVPKLSLSKYIAGGFSIDLSTTISSVKRVEGFFANNFDYFSIDGTIRYDFGLSKENMVPYIGLGMGWIGAPDTLPGANATPTTNFALGTTYWFSPKFGLNVEAVYKYSRDDYESMRSHSQFSAGLIYSFKPRLLVQRIWHANR